MSKEPQGSHLAGTVIWASTAFTYPSCKVLSLIGKQILLQQPAAPLPMLTFLLGSHPFKPVIKAPLLGPSMGQAGLRLHVPAQAKSDQWGACRQHPNTAPLFSLRWNTL